MGSAGRSGALSRLLRYFVSLREVFFMATTSPFRRLAIVVGGGPAPGINGVISAVTIEADNRKIEVYGIQDGYKDLVKADASRIRRLHKYEVAQLYIRGGSM